MSPIFYSENGLYNKLSPFYKFFYWILFLGFITYISTLIYIFHKENIIQTPSFSGEIKEGSLGLPIYKNPLIDSNQSERDINAILHLGLLKYSSSGELEKELATLINHKENELLISILENAVFHDGFKLTTKDIEATIKLTKLLPNGNKYKEWYRDIEVEIIDDFNIKIYSENNIDTRILTIPIIPSHIWNKIDERDFIKYKRSNAYIGAGPYKQITENATIDGRIKKIEFASFDNYILGKPYIEKIEFNFYEKIENLISDFVSGKINGIHSIAGSEVKLINSKKIVNRATTNKVFSILFNGEDGEILNDIFIRNILSRNINRDEIIKNSLDGYGRKINYPFALDLEVQNETLTNDELIQTLEDIGWKFKSAAGVREKNGESLEINFSYLDINEQESVAKAISKQWRELGVLVKEQKIDEINKVIDNKDFDAILYGYEASNYEDILKLWDSAKDDNLSKITNFGLLDVNEIIETIRNKPIQEQENMYNKIKVKIAKNSPAIFLYSPLFIYLTNIDIKSNGKNLLNHINDPSDRFAEINKWYLKKRNTYKIFYEK